MQFVVDDSQIVLDTAIEGYVRFNANLRLTYINPVAESLLGSARSVLLGKRLRDVSQRVGSLEEVCRRGMAERAPVTREDYFPNLERWYAITALPDAVGGVVVRFSDITERKRMEESHRKLEEKFSKAFRSSPTPMCIVDIDNNASLLEVNDA